jgi:hypothetical protein
MNNIVPLHKCTCGAVGQPRTLTWEDETLTIFSCDKCVDITTALIARMRPVFETMRACGVPRGIASDTMTFMFDHLPDTDILEEPNEHQ